MIATVPTTRMKLCPPSVEAVMGRVSLVSGIARINFQFTVTGMA